MDVTFLQKVVLRVSEFHVPSTAETVIATAGGNVFLTSAATKLPVVGSEDMEKEQQLKERKRLFRHPL